MLFIFSCHEVLTVCHYVIIIYETGALRVFENGAKLQKVADVRNRSDTKQSYDFQWQKVKVLKVFINDINVKHPAGQKQS